MTTPAKAAVKSAVAARGDTTIALSRALHAEPETAWQEPPLRDRLLAGSDTRGAGSG